MRQKTILCILIGCLLAMNNLLAGNPVKQVVREIDSLLSDNKAQVGVAVLTDDGQRILVNNDARYPLMSVFKIPVALAVLHKLDREHISPDQIIPIKAAQLLPNTYSPLRDKFPNQDISISFRDLLKYSITLSDNNACDILIDYAGGIAEVDKYLKTLGVKDISLSATEAQMHEDNKRPDANWGTPSAMTDLLKLFHDKDLFARPYKDFLWNTLIETSTGKDKLKGLLPEEVVVGHKTGSSNRTKEGIKIGDNDAGFVCLPDGTIYYIAVFVMNSQETDKTNASIIAQISKIVYEYMLIHNIKH